MQAEALRRNGHDAHGRSWPPDQVSDHGSRTAIRDLHDLGNAGDGLRNIFPRITFGVFNSQICQRLQLGQGHDALDCRPQLRAALVHAPQLGAPVRWRRISLSA